MQKLKIRRYKKEDNPVVWELHQLGLAEIGGKASHGSPWDKDMDNIENTYLKEGDFIIGEYEGRVVSMGAFKKINNVLAELKRMRVHPDFQRRGFGQAIIEELEKRARKMGYRKVVLDTSERNFKAKNFYQKNGYKEFKRDTLNIRNGTFHVIFYEKELTISMDEYLKKRFGKNNYK